MGSYGLERVMYSILIADIACAPPLSRLHSSLVPLHPGVCVSRDIASSSKPDHFDIKAKACCSLSTMRRMSWENDPVRGWSSPRTTWSHLRGAVSAFPCVCTVKAEWPGAWTEKAMTCLRANSPSPLHLSYRPWLGVSEWRESYSVIRPKLLLTIQPQNTVNNILIKTDLNVC